MATPTRRSESTSCTSGSVQCDFATCLLILFVGKKKQVPSTILSYFGKIKSSFLTKVLVAQGQRFRVVDLSVCQDIGDGILGEQGLSGSL